MVLALDRAAGSFVRSFDADGRLRTVARISKATVNSYRAEEIPGWIALGLDPRLEYRLLRHPDELRKAAASFSGLPLLSMHRPIGADAHPRDLVVGTVGTDVTFRGPHLVASVVVWDRDAIAGIDDGSKRELSCGYRYVADMTPGTFEGKRYDGVMRDIRGNHIALVDNGRAGPDCTL
jgi:uncharacterized protein